MINRIRVSNSMDQAQHIVRPDLGPNCLRSLSADYTSSKRVKAGHYFNIEPSYIEKILSVFLLGDVFPKLRNPYSKSTDPDHNACCE